MCMDEAMMERAREEGGGRCLRVGVGVGGGRARPVNCL